MNNDQPPTPASHNQEEPDNPAEIRVLDLLRQIKAGSISVKMLTVPARRALVAHLILRESMPTPEIAELLQISDRSVERDRRAIRENTFAAPDPNLIGQMVGRLVAEADLCIERIRRILRDKTVEPAVKIDGEHRCFLITANLFQLLQRVGYLPTAAQRVQAELNHSVQIPTFDEINKELERLSHIAESSDDQTGLSKLKETVTRASLDAEIKKLRSSLLQQQDQQGENP